MAVDGGGDGGLPLEAHFRWRLRLTASLAVSPPRQDPVARPGRGNGGLGYRAVAEAEGLATPSQPRAGVTQRTLRRLAPRPRSGPSLTGTWPRRLQGPGPAVPWASPLPAHAALGAAQPQPGPALLPDSSWPEATGSHHRVATAPQPRRGHPCPHTTRRAQEPAPGGRQARGSGPCPRSRSRTRPRRRHGGGRGFCRRELWRDTPTGTQVAAPGRGAGGGGQVQVEGLAGRRDGNRARGVAWVRARHPGVVWGAAAFQGRLLAAWRAGPAGSAPSGARAVVGGA